MNIKTLLIAGALAAMVMTGNTFAQGCASGNCGGVIVGEPYFGDPNQAGYSYDLQGCNQCGAPDGRCSCGQKWREKWEHTKARHEKVAARNAVWPKPFDCADRQLYFSIWEPMLDAGYQKHCTLTQAHFDPESNELNNYGQSAVSGIMRNMPRHRKAIFIHRDTDQQLSDARMNSVRNSIQTWYGGENTASIAFTDDLPTRSSGGRVESINRLYNEGTPPPIIPVASGTGSVSQSTN